MNSGYDVEILFEQRLRQLGYSGACRPAREDCGVDYVLFTTKGWVGIQVKSAKGNNRGKSLRIKLDGTQKKPLRMVVLCELKSGRSRSTKNKTIEHYLRAGVSVFALHHQGIFYLVPIANAKPNGVYVSATSVFREAWHEVLGLPIEPLTQEEQRQDEVAQMETLYSEAQ